MSSASRIRETLRYARRFSGQSFVMRLDTADRLDVRFIDDIKILLALGMRIAFVCGEISGARADLEPIATCCAPESHEAVDVVARGGAAAVLCGNMKQSMLDELTLELAIMLKASKLFLMTSSDGIHDQSGLIHELDVGEARNILSVTRESVTGRTHPMLGNSMRARLELAIQACEAGIHRVHFLGVNRDGSLLEELFLAGGNGTMVYQKRNGYATIRGACPDDLPELLRLLSEARVTNYAQHEIERLLDDVLVRAVDEQLSGCIMLGDSDQVATLRFAAASGEDISGVLSELVEYAYRLALDRGAREVVLQNPNQDWLTINPVLGRLGFVQGEPDKLWRATVV